MKKLILLLVTSLFIIQGIIGQTTEKVVVDVNDLTPEQIERLKEKDRLRTMDEKIKQYGK